MFIFILAINDVIGFDFSSTLNILSFILAIVTLMFLFALAIFPLVIIKMVLNKHYNHSKKTSEAFWEVVAKSYFSDLKKEFYSMAYYSAALTRNFIFALSYICLSNNVVQLNIWLAVTIAFTAYMVMFKPFENPIKNILTILNESIIFVMGIVMLNFINGDLNKNAYGYLLISITAVSIILFLTVGNILHVYLMCKKYKQRKLKQSGPIVQDESEINIERQRSEGNKPSSVNAESKTFVHRTNFDAPKVNSPRSNIPYEIRKKIESRGNSKYRRQRTPWNLPEIKNQKW